MKTCPSPPTARAPSTLSARLSGNRVTVPKWVTPLPGQSSPWCAGSLAATTPLPNPDLQEVGATDHRVACHKRLGSAPNRVPSACATADGVQDVCPVSADMLIGTPGVCIRNTKPPRYEQENPRDLVHVEVKNPGRIPDEGGHRTLRSQGRCQEHLNTTHMKPHDLWAGLSPSHAAYSYTCQMSYSPSPLPSRRWSGLVLGMPVGGRDDWQVLWNPRGISASLKHDGLPRVTQQRRKKHGRGVPTL